jgi:hypothetical protein
VSALSRVSSVQLLDVYVSRADPRVPERKGFVRAQLFPSAVVLRAVPDAPDKTLSCHARAP